MKPGAPPLQSTRLLDQVRERIRYLHYSLKTEKTYLYRTRFFIRWSATQPGGIDRPRDIEAKDIHLFTWGQVSYSNGPSYSISRLKLGAAIAIKSIAA